MGTTKIMITLKKIITSATMFTLAFALVGPSTVFAATSPTLGAAGSYSVLGHTTVTNTGGTTMPGDLGISTGGAPTGFPPGTVGPPGSIRNAGDSLAAQNASTAAYLSLDQGCDTTYTGTKDLVSEDLVAGVYCADAFTLTGDLNLIGTGVWIFKSASSLITSGTARVLGGDPCNVWWRNVSSATLGANTQLTGNILSSTSVSMQTGAALNGRALAQTGAVTLDSNIITGAACLTPASSVAVTPGLPNTGIATVDSLSNIMAAFIAGIALALVAVYTLKKKSVA